MEENDLPKFKTLSELNDFVNQLKKTTKIFSKKEIEDNLKKNKTKGFFAKENIWYLLNPRLDFIVNRTMNFLKDKYDFEFAVGDDFEMLLFSEKLIILFKKDLPDYSSKGSLNIELFYNFYEIKPGNDFNFRWYRGFDGVLPHIEVTEQKNSKGYLVKHHTPVEYPNGKIDLWSYDFYIYNIDVYNTLYNLNKYRKEKLEELKNSKKLKEKQRIKELKESQTNILSELDKDGNGEVDVVEGNDFNLLLKKHQKTIIEVDKNYVQQFVKVSSYLKKKKGNIQSIFNSIKDTPNQEMLNEYVEILKDDIHTYNLVLFNSLNMIVSLVEDDMITFYEIHEMFDNLNMFDSKHEKDVSQKLINIGDGLKDLMYEVRRMGNKISDSIHELSYVTEETNTQLTNQLSEIDSSIKVGNLISVINTDQNYKTNRRLNS